MSINYNWPIWGILVKLACFIQFHLKRNSPYKLKYLFNVRYLLCVICCYYYNIINIVKTLELFSSLTVPLFLICRLLMAISSISLHQMALILYHRTSCLSLMYQDLCLAENSTRCVFTFLFRCYKLTYFERKENDQSDM